MKSLTEFKVEEISKEQAIDVNGGSAIIDAVAAAVKAVNELTEFMKNPPK